jgi:hypothetical protein
MGQGACVGAVAKWRKFCRAHVLPRLVRRPHVGRDDAKRAAIEHPLDLVDAWHPHQGSHAHLERRHADLARCLEGKTRVLHVHIEAVEARGLGDAGDLDAVNEAHGHGGGDLVARELFLQVVA